MRARRSKPADEEGPAAEPGADNEFGPGRTQPVKNKPGDPDLVVPAGQRAQYEAAFAKFCAVFPDAFYIEERGRNYFDTTKDRGRLLSAGFHNLMGYFRDDQPLYELVLDEKQQQELDEMWRELDFVASANIRTYMQFYLNEGGGARKAANGRERRLHDPKIKRSLPKRKSSKSPRIIWPAPAATRVAIKAIEDHFKWVNDGIRWVEKSRVDAEPSHLESLLDFAARAYRRPLTPDERDELQAYYHSLRGKDGLDHESAVRDCVVSVLMSPDFCYRIDLVEASPGGRIHPLSDYDLASRLSYFLWSSMPDKELLDHAAAADLQRPEVLTAQARRMLKDPQIRALAVEFGGNWLDFRRFEELNTVDRERFTAFTNELRTAMFEEPVRFMLDVFQTNRSVLDFLYANDTFVNPALARHYGMPEFNIGPNEWVRIDDANRYNRGGLLPMAVFLTKNAPGLRTSPVKRGYWVVKNVLGQRIPPPPAAVPELPRDEAKLDLPLREMLAHHREDPVVPPATAGSIRSAWCSKVSARLANVVKKTWPATRSITALLFPAAAKGPVSTVCDGISAIAGRTISSKIYAASSWRTGSNRSLILSDDVTIQEMRGKLADNDYRFSSLIESIVTSPQFLKKRGRDEMAKK